jgi:hypothetical protein
MRFRPPTPRRPRRPGNRRTQPGTRQMPRRRTQPCAGSDQGSPPLNPTAPRTRSHSRRNSCSVRPRSCRRTTVRSPGCWRTPFVQFALPHQTEREKKNSSSPPPITSSAQRNSPRTSSFACMSGAALPFPLPQPAILSGPRSCSGILLPGPTTTGCLSSIGAKSRSPEETFGKPLSATARALAAVRLAALDMTMQHPARAAKRSRTGPLVSQGTHPMALGPTSPRWYPLRIAAMCSSITLTRPSTTPPANQARHASEGPHRKSRPVSHRNCGY